jgi:hypothetical protein
MRAPGRGRPQAGSGATSLAESFFASLKGELIDTRPWPTRAAASHATVEYIG